jgi:transposase InsO family protein
LLLGNSRQAYYQGVKYQQKEAFQDDLIIEEVLQYRKHQKRLGTRKLLEEMEAFLELHCFKIGRDAMFTLLDERGLLVRKRKRKGPLTTFSRHRFKKYPNLIREFIPTGPNQLWVSDITYIHVGDRFAYLSLITDAYSRKIVGFYLCEDLTAEGPLTALKMALKNNPVRPELIHHSDRGVQYCCDKYVKLLSKNEVKISMTENGDPLENAIAERVNGILKDELLEVGYSLFSQAQNGIAVAISTYNHLRPHGSIDNLKPADAHKMEGPIKQRWVNYYQRNQQKLKQEALMTG